MSDEKKQKLTKEQGVKNIMAYYNVVHVNQQSNHHQESLDMITKLMTNAEGYAELMTFFGFYLALDSHESLKMALDIMNYRQSLPPEFMEKVVFGEMPGVIGNPQVNQN